MNNNNLYPEIEAACHALNGLVFPVLTEKANSLGLDLREAGFLLAIPTFEPDPVSVGIIRVRSPYTSIPVVASSLASLKEHGFLDPAGVDTFHINRKGLEAVKELNQSIYASISSIQTLPPKEMTELVTRLKELSDACFHAPEPPGKWCLLHSRRQDPGVTAPLMVRIDQHLSELAAYRDDAHLASWKNLVDDGHAWDILTYLWSEKESTLEEINNALSRRGNSLSQTKQSLVSLFKKHWVEITGETICISSLGSTIRETAEENTNRFFYAPFLNYNEFQLTRTFELIKKHRREIPAV
jgi:DNA-binding PadR family transcriptional regulator